MKEEIKIRGLEVILVGSLRNLFFGSAEEMVLRGEIVLRDADIRPRLRFRGEQGRQFKEKKRGKKRLHAAPTKGKRR